jgi:hypothetical protein
MRLWKIIDDDGDVIITDDIEIAIDNLTIWGSEVVEVTDAERQPLDDLDRAIAAEERRQYV